MALTIQQIINEVDTFVPNTFDMAKKLTWINEVNREFFEYIKIPSVVTVNFPTQPLNPSFPADMRGRNIFRVQAGNVFYLSLQYEQVNPGQNYWVSTDEQPGMNLTPRPSPETNVVVSYYKTAVRTYASTDLLTSPEAPSEYHWAYVLGLAERVAKAMNDVTLANNFAGDYKALLQVAQQNYSPREGR